MASKTNGEKAFNKLHDLTIPLVVNDLAQRGATREVMESVIKGLPTWETAPDTIKDAWEQLAKYCAEGFKE